MNWLTLSLGEVAFLSLVAAGVALWLYLRQPRALRLRVSTLLFWENAPSISSEKRRLKLREPWPFLAQVLFLIAVIAALGNPRRGGVVTQGRSVAMVIDSSAWSQMQPQGRPSWLEEIRRQANDFVAKLPAGDRVLLLHADADGAPILPFTTDRSALAGAIARLQPSSAVADVPNALQQGAAALAGSSRSLVVYIGPGIMNEKQIQDVNNFEQTLKSSGGQTQFLARLVENSAPLANRGITRLALKRSEEQANQWSLLTELRNYEGKPAQVTLSLSVNGQAFRREQLALPANSSSSVTDDFTSPRGGLLQAEISPSDQLNADNRAAIQLPSSEPVSVAVLTGRDGFITRLRTVLSADPYVLADFIVPGAKPQSDVVIYDGSVPPDAVPGNYISFVVTPSADALHRVRLTNWNAGHPVTRWIQSRDVSVRVAGPLETKPGDVVLASSAGPAPSPLIIAREQNGYRAVIVGFDPLDSNFTMEPAFPLLIAASLEWMTRPVGERAEGLTAGALDFPGPISSITSPSGRDVAFSENGDDAHVFAAESGLYRLKDAGRIGTLPVNVPPLPAERWNPSTEELGAAIAEPIAGRSEEIWRWLVGFAILALWLEWWLFYFPAVRTSQTSLLNSTYEQAKPTRSSAKASSVEERKAVARF